AQPVRRPQHQPGDPGRAGPDPGVRPHAVHGIARHAERRAPGARHGVVDRHRHDRRPDPVDQSGVHPDLRADLLGPVGVPRPAPVATMLAMWSLSSSWSRFIGGKIAAMAATETVGGQVLDPHAALVSAITVFTWIGVAGMASGVVFLATGPLVRAWGEDTDLA